ncbi:hypothetical protein AYO44_10650 [Planctomycetaceae bacterium SCGC AG-212-F19]|nr:hypothetical protein AYO44_10650 [Planctomycetaceae bacterium SCGC AG-212-F19]
MNVVTYFDAQAKTFANAYGQAADFRARYALWTELIDRYASRRFARSCIDLGCGPGLFSFYAAECGLTTVGLDASSRMLELCEAEKARRRLTNIQFMQGSLPLLDPAGLEPADLILCSSVLEYVEHWERTVSGIYRLMNLGGHFLVSLPNGQSVYRHYEKWKFRLTGQPAYYRHVRHLLSVDAAIRWFERFGLACREYHFYGDEPWLSRLAACALPERFYKNLYVLVLARK